MGILRDQYTVGNIGNAIFKGSLARFGKSQWSSFYSGSLYTRGNNNIVEGALARFGKISMKFLHLGGLQEYQTVVSKVQVTNTRMGQ